ncbi:MAG: class I adenylate-forming enzyme family protein [Candidatus Hodarchaeota archaeon]
MKDYSDWELIYDYENESPYVDPNRLWSKHRTSKMPKTIYFEPIPVHEFMKLNAKKFLNNICVYHKPTDKKYTYRELIYTASKISNALYEIGVSKGDGVGIMSGNCPEFIFCVLGILETGAMVVPINPLLRQSDVTHIVREAGNIKAIFVHKANYRTIKKTRKLVEVPNVILLAAEEAKEDTITLEEFINDKVAKSPDVDLDPLNDIAALMFTGGTTGLPKGVMLTHNNLVSNALALICSRDSTFEELEASLGKEVNLSILPLCHSFGFIIVIIMLYAAWMLVMFASFDPAEVLEAIEYYRIKMYIGVPVMFQMLINHPDFKERDLSSIESAGSSSAALAPELARRWEKIVGTKVFQGYGLTEASPGTHMAGEWMQGIKPESIGIPLINTDVKIVDPDTLEELKTGEIGEILITGPQIMKGYWKRPEATKRDIVNGWLRSGDLGRMDDNGYFYIEGRTKDMIKYKGYKVMPREVEEKLFEHPAILEAGVVGVPDPNIGETIKAFVVLKKEYREGQITERDIIEWSKERLAGYKYPRQVEFIKSLPRTTIGKIYRKKLREMELEKQEKSLAT